MTAFMDCMIFLVIMMMAISVTVVIHSEESDPGEDPEDMLLKLARTEVRLSDLTPIDDDALVYLTDAMAYSVDHESLVDEYLESILGYVYGKHGYFMTYSYGDGQVRLGEQMDYFRYSSSSGFRVSTGGTVYITIGVI